MKCSRITAVCVGIVFAAYAGGATAGAAEAVMVPVEDGIVLADKSGQMYIHLLSGDSLHVTADKTEPEGIFRYYDAELVNESETGSAVYQMELSGCEYLVDSGKYASVYTVSFSPEKNVNAIYTVQFSVKDPDFEDVSGSEMHFYITMEPAAENGFQLMGDIEYEDDNNILILEHHVLLQYAEKVQGDADGDGTVNIADATAVLTYYAMSSAGLEPSITAEAADTDGDGTVGINDATAILTYYAMNASGMNPKWSDIIK